MTDNTTNLLENPVDSEEIIIPEVTPETSQKEVTQQKLYYALSPCDEKRINKGDAGDRAIWEYDYKMWYFEHEEKANIVAEDLCKNGRKIVVVRRPSKIVDTLLNGTNQEKKAIKARCKYEIELMQYRHNETLFRIDCEKSKLDKSVIMAPLGQNVSEKWRKTYEFLRKQYDKLEKEKQILNESLKKCEKLKAEAADYKNTGDYIVKKSGLYFFPENNIEDKEKEEVNDKIKEVWISSPIWPEAYLRNNEGGDHTLLFSVFDGEKFHKIPLPRKVIAQWAKLSEILLDVGQRVPMSTTNQKHLQNFLQNTRPEKKMRCVSKSGWHGEQYIFPDGEVIGSALDSESVYPLNLDIPKGLKQKGSHEDWLRYVWELCANNSRLIFSVGVSLAAPCMNLVDEDSGGFNFVGDSSIGKSRCLETAISVYGSPDFKRSWKNTSNGFEAICALHHDLLLPMDEGGQADPKELGENIYMFSQGQGKGRMYKDTNARDSKDWRAMLLSTAENGLNVLMQEAKKKPKPGQLVRIADIPAAVKNKFGCFENLHGFENGVDGEIFAEKIKEVTRKYYGTAGREFIRSIIKYGLDNAKEDLNNLSDDFAADAAIKYDPQVKRVANRFGLVYAALSLAIKLGVLKGRIVDEAARNAVKSCFLDWLGKRGTTGNMEASNIVEQVKNLLIEHSDGKFIDVSEFSDDKRLRNTLWGCRDGAIFYVFCSAFKEHLCHGHESEQAIETLIKENLLDPKRGEFQKKINGINTRCYRINLGEQYDT